MRRLLLASLIALAALPAAALAHVERPSDWPHYPAQVPDIRSTGPAIVVCQADSRARILRLPDRAMRAQNLRLLRRCHGHRSIQTAVDRAGNGTRILLLPGVYREPRSRAKPDDDPRCSGMKVKNNEGTLGPSYEYQRACPNAQNLVAIVGDSDGDRRCDDKCNLQILGAARARDVRIEGNRRKWNVIRADRADGIVLAHFTVQYSGFNNIYVLETAGFRVQDIVTRWSAEYGVLSFTSEAGLYDHIDAYGNGDSGVYPGSGSQGLEAERNCQAYGTELRYVDSHDNNMGYSGTAGDSVWVHDSKFHHNATGLATDSFAAGHPGMPQHCAKWERNQIYSNNFNVFTPERQEYCKKPYEERDPKIVCSAFQVPVGTGAIIAGGNRNLLLGNQVWDNWRNGFMLLWVPAAVRGDSDPAHQVDTSFDNRYEGNRMGVTPDGDRALNGTDFWWDEEGAGNCWTGNTGPGGAAVTGDPASLPSCPGSPVFSPGRVDKTARQAPCATWDPHSNPNPPGCDWFTTPPKPGSGRARAIAAAQRSSAAAARRLVLTAPARGALEWQAPPLLMTQALLRHDRIVSGRVVNRSLGTVSLRASDLRVLTAGGRRMRADAVFVGGFLHRLWPFNRSRGARPLQEQLRTGVRVRLKPGDSAPLTIAWRSPADVTPARVVYRGGSLPLG